MKAVGVFFLSLFTSVAASAGTVYGIERLSLIPKKAPEVPRSPVPKVAGLSEDDARNNLAARGLVMLIEERKPTSAVDEGHVMSQSVAAGEPLARGDAVSVTIAAALPKVPDVTTLTVEAASAALVRAGYRLEVGKPIVQDGVPEGQVAAQSPAPDTALEKDSVITVRVSTTPKPIEVPKLVGLTMDVAKKRVTDAGLEPNISWISVPDRQAFLVMRQDPLGGKELESGQTVKLFVNR